MTNKERILATIRSMPDDVTFDEAVQKLCFLAAVEEGLAQANAGELIGHEEIVREFLGAETEGGTNRLNAS